MKKTFFVSSKAKSRAAASLTCHKTKFPAVRPPSLNVQKKNKNSESLFMQFLRRHSYKTA